MGNYSRDNNSGSRGNFGNRSFGGGDREMFKATCADCGKSCEIPFRPSNGRPVYCRDCFKKNSPQDSRGEDRNNFSRDRGGDRGRSSQDRPMFDAVCDNCGDKCRVPFAPRDGKETLCSNCFEAKGGDPRSTNNQSSQLLSEVNAKLDRILELLVPTPKAAKKEKVVEAEEMLGEEVMITEEVEVKKPKAKKKVTKKV